MPEPSFEGVPVLVTGGAGFIGAHLVEALVARGAEVRVLDDLSSGFESNLDAVRGQVELLIGDICDAALCERACSGMRFVFHQAARGSVPRSLADPAGSVRVNVTGTANVFAGARTAGVARVVYASSSSVYGDDERLPKREGQEGAVLSPYAASKRMNEELAEVFARCYPMSFAGLRYFNVFGPRQSPEGPYAAVVPRFFEAARRGEAPTIYGDGEQSRDFTFVGDVVRANLLAAGASFEGAWAFNIGAGGTTSVNELARSIIDAVGADVEPAHVGERQGDIRHSQADTSRARDVLGFEPTTTLAEGLAQIQASQTATGSS